MLLQAIKCLAEAQGLSLSEEKGRYVLEKVEEKPAAPAKPTVKAGGVAGSCDECFQSGLECACGKAACRCCAPGDSNCNAYDL